MEDSRRMGFV